MKIDFELNGRACSREVPGMTRLLDLLREEIGATGAKEGCGEGECGACTVLLEGTPVCSCLVPSVQVIGCKVQTVEGLETSTGLHRIDPGGVCGAWGCTVRHLHPRLSDDGSLHVRVEGTGIRRECS